MWFKISKHLGILERRRTMIRRQNCFVIVVLCVFVTLVLPSLVPSTSQKPSIINRTDLADASKLMIIHYHKTGHDLSFILAVAGFRKEAIRFKSPKTSLQDVIRWNQNSTENNILLVDGLNLNQDWKTWLPPMTRVIHLIRDPFEWTLSAYLYHRQIPAPYLEKWVTKVEKDPCPNHYDSFAKHQLQVDLRPIQQLCRMLISHVNNTNTSLSLSELLQTLTPSDGIRLEAARGLLGAKHGILLTMAQNIQYSIPAVHHQVRSFSLSRFTQSADSFLSTVHQICNFGKDLLVNMTVEDCISYSFHYGSLHSNHSKELHPGHVTSNQLSKQKRQDLLAVLKEDDDLGEPLRRLQAYLTSHSVDMR